MSTSAGSSLVSRFGWQFVDAIGWYLLYCPLRPLFRLLQMPMQGYLDSYYILSDQERMERQGMLKSHRAWLRLYLVWLVVLLLSSFALLAFYQALSSVIVQIEWLLAFIMSLLGVFYAMNMVAFWLDIDRFMRGERFSDHEMYLSPYLQIDEEMKLHFFTIADLIASGALSSSQEEIRKQIASGVAEGFSKIKHCIDSGELNRTAELRFHQYTLHPRTLARWGFRLYQPILIRRWWEKYVAILAWPRAAYVSSFTRPQMLRLSHIQRLTFSRGKAKEFRQ